MGRYLQNVLGTRTAVDIGCGYREHISKKSCPSFYSEHTMGIGQEFLDILYIDNVDQ